MRPLGLNEAAVKRRKKAARELRTFERRCDVEESRKAAWRRRGISLTRILNSSTGTRKILDSIIKPRSPDDFPGSSIVGTPIIAGEHLPKLNWSLLGTAVDYAVRFEMARVLSQVVEHPWIAENPRLADDCLCPEDWRSRVTGARRFISNYRIALSRAKGRTLRALARHSLRLAELDLLYRSDGSTFPYGSEEPSRDNTDTVMATFERCPWDKLSCFRRAILNPVLDDSEHDIKADADMICDDVLVEIKCTAKPSITLKSMRQLVAYAALIQRKRRVDRNFPVIRSLAILFPRQGILWKRRLPDVVDMDRFRISSKKFLLAAKKARLYFW